MKLKPQASPPTLSDDNLIPMINVVFLLLIFFMVAGTIRHSDPLAIDTPLSGSGIEQTAQAILYIDTSGTLFLDETLVTADELSEVLAVRMAVSAVRHSNDDHLSVPEKASGELDAAPTLAIKADAATSIALLRQVLEDARVAGIHSVELITQQAYTVR